MINFKLTINDNILVIDNEKLYKSSIQDIREDCISINIPVNDGIYLTLNKGDELELEYLVDSGCYFSFKCIVLERLREKNINLYRLSSPVDIQKIQRRDFVRVNIIENAFYRKESEKKWQKATITDLSGGGLRINIKDKINLGDKLFVNLFIDETKLTVLGKVVRLEKNDERENVCGLEFIDLEEKLRDKIIGKVFIQMRKQRDLV